MFSSENLNFDVNICVQFLRSVFKSIFVKCGNNGNKAVVFCGTSVGKNLDKTM